MIVNISVGVSTVGLDCSRSFADPTMEPSEKQIVPAPFEGYLKTVNVNLGDMVFSEKSSDIFDNFIHSSPVAPLIVFPHPPEILATLNTAEYQSKWLGALDDYYTHIADKYRALATGQLNDVARRQIRPDALVWIVVGDAAKVKPQFDSWALYDNSVDGRPAVLIDSGRQAGG